MISPIFKQIEDVCKEQYEGRECGGFQALDWNTKCFKFDPSERFATLDEWYESFPHIMLEFEPNASIPLYPRDYFFLENGLQCMGFSYLEGRIILGGLFMRNFDVQFDRENQILRMVRSDCGKVPDPNFKAFYYHHSDPRYNPSKPIKTKIESKDLDIKTTGGKPEFWIIAVFSFIFILSIVIYAIFFRRYEDRESGASNFNRVEMVYEL